MVAAMDISTQRHFYKLNTQRGKENPDAPGPNSMLFDTLVEAEAHYDDVYFNNRR